MAVETAADLAAFTNPDEFGVVAIWNGVSITGIPDTFHLKERPGENSRSSISSYIAAAADVSSQVIQFLTAWGPISAVAQDDTLTITGGDHAGAYRIRDIQRDGEMCRLMLNIL